MKFSFKPVVGFVLGLMVAITVFFSQNVHAYDVPRYQGLVNDYAQVLSPEFESLLEAQLTSVAQATAGAEVMVVTITSLEGDSIENVAQEFGETWGVGKKESDNGVLFLAVISDRQMRIHTGYGTQIYITDAAAGRIIRDIITPHFREEDYQAGVQAGVDSILATIQNPDLFAASGSDSDPYQGFAGMILVVFFLSLFSGLFIYVAAFFGRSKAWWPGGVVGAAAGAVLGRPFDSSLITMIGLATLGLTLDYILSKNYQSWSLQKKATSWRKTLGGFKSGGMSGRSSSGSSGFSSGGGSFGGGGASGSW